MNVMNDQVSDHSVKTDLNRPEAIDRMRRNLFAASAVMVPAALATSALTAIPGVANADTPDVAKPNDNKVAIVTGSSRGLGEATVKRLAQDGLKVTVNCEKNVELAENVANTIKAAGGEAIWVQADVSDPSAVKKLFDQTEQTYGRVDVVINNAGIMNLGNFSEMEDKDFDRMMDVNVKGGFNVLREASRRVQDGGKIISLSSTIVKFNTPGYGPYAATKAALQTFSSVLAKELAGGNISVNTVAPGVCATSLFLDVPGRTQADIDQFAQRTPHKRIGEPTDIANVISALVSSDGYWINGETVYANGGIA